jgi:hypothetical protein
VHEIRKPRELRSVKYYTNNEKVNRTDNYPIYKNAKRKTLFDLVASFRPYRLYNLCNPTPKFIFFVISSAFLK